MKASRLKQQPSPTGLVSKVWSVRVDGEPSVAELLSDPIIHSLMRRDGVTLDALNAIIDTARTSARFDLARHAA